MLLASCFFFLVFLLLALAACNDFLALAAGNSSSDALPLLQAGSADIVYCTRIYIYTHIWIHVFWSRLAKRRQEFRRHNCIPLAVIRVVRICVARSTKVWNQLLSCRWALGGSVLGKSGRFSATRETTFLVACHGLNQLVWVAHSFSITGTCCGCFNLDCCKVSVWNLEFQPTFSACNQCTDHPAGETFVLFPEINMWREQRRILKSSTKSQHFRSRRTMWNLSLRGSRLLLGARLQDMLVELQPSNDAVKADPRWLEVVVHELRDQIMTKPWPNHDQIGSWCAMVCCSALMDMALDFRSIQSNYKHHANGHSQFNKDLDLFRMIPHDSGTFLVGFTRIETRVVSCIRAFCSCCLDFMIHVPQPFAC